MKPTQTAEFLRRGDAAAYLGVSPRTISDWQKKRVIPFVKMSRKCVLFRRSDLIRAVERFTVKAVAQ